MIVLKKVVFSFLIGLLSISVGNIANAAPTANRLSGDSRYDTSIVISNEGWQQSEYAILATGENYPDALAATPLASVLQCPILLTGKDTLSRSLEDELYRLGVREVFILGGTAVVSQKVENQLTAENITVNRISGVNRYETAVKIAEKLSEYSSWDEIITVTGEDYADALSVASIAGTKNIPIILVTKYSVPNTVLNFLSAIKINKTYVIGDDSIGTSQIISQLPSVEKITGASKYDRNIAVIDRFKKELNINTVFVGTGENFPDSLSGSALAVQGSNPIVLVNSNNIDAQKELINNSNVDSVVLLGGTGAISEEISEELIGEVTTTIGQTKAELEVVETHWENRYLAGTIKNNSKDLYLSINVEINLYDEYGDQVGTETVTATNLEPGKQWKFRPLIREKDATDYKVMKITGIKK